MFEKSSVTSIKTNPLYAELLARTGQTPKWNFHKYLVDRDGKQIASFGTRVEPDNADLLSALERMLAAKPGVPKS
jgi:glutathione peroxidase